MDLQLDGRQAIVTGSSAGIGEAIARRLAAEGAAVIVHGRRGLAIARAVADVADSLGLSSSLVALAWLRAQGGVIPILGARTAQQLADNLACLDVALPPEALARLDQASRIARGFPHDFLAGADYTLGGMSAQLDMPPGRARYG